MKNLIHHFICLLILTTLATATAAVNHDYDDGDGNNNGILLNYAEPASAPAPAHESEYEPDSSHPQITPEMLIGTWILESQTTTQSLFERAVIFESGVKLLYLAGSETGMPFFWTLYDNVLTSHLLAGPEYRHDMPIQIADGTLIFLYDDGETATYVRPYDDDCLLFLLPEGMIKPELVGLWFMIGQTTDEYGNFLPFPDVIEFLPDGSGTAYVVIHLETGIAGLAEVSFEWNVIDGAVLFKHIYDTDSNRVEVPLIFRLAFYADFDTYILDVVHSNGTVSRYVLAPR